MIKWLCLLWFVLGAAFRGEATMIDLIRAYQPSMPIQQTTYIADRISYWANKWNVNVYTVAAIVAQESSFDPTAVGTRGERGLMQITRPALKELERKYDEKFDFNRLFDIDHNLSAGTLYYRYCTDLANNDRKEAISRYRTTFEPQDSSDYARNVMLIRRVAVRFIT